MKASISRPSQVKMVLEKGVSLLFGSCKIYLQASTSDKTDWTAWILLLQLPFLRMGSHASTNLTMAAINASLSLCIGRMKC